MEKSKTREALLREVEILRARVAELEQREQARQEGERRGRRVLDHLYAFAGVLEPDGTLIEVNQTALNAANLEPEDVIGKPFWETYWWAYSPEVQAQLKDAIERAARGEVSRYDVAVRLAPDHLITTDFQLSPMCDDEGNVLLLIPSAVDISGRVATERELRLSEERFRAALENSPVTVWNQDRELRYTWLYNPHLRYFAPDVIGKRDLDLVERRADAERLEAIKRRVIETGERAREEVTIHRNGDTGYFDLVVEPQRNEAGIVTGVICTSTDITELKQAERELRMSEERFRTALKDSPITIWQRDRDLRYTWVYNPRLNATESELLGRRERDVLERRDEAEYIEALLQQVLDTGQSIHEEIRIHHEWLPYYFDLVVEPLRDENGNIVGLTGASTEITGRKAMEKRLRESEQRFRATFEQAAVGIAHIGLMGDFIRANDRLCGILGYSHAELQERTFQGITHPEDLELDLELLDRLLRGEIETYSLDKRFTHKNGSPIWVNLTMSLIRHADATPRYYVAVMQDISQRVAMEQQVAASEERLRLAVEAARLGTWDWDVESGRISWTGYTAEILGLQLDEGHAHIDQIVEIVYADDSETVLAVRDEVTADGGEFSIEFRVDRPTSGDVVWVEVRGEAYTDARGQVVRVSGTVQDVNERKLIERERTRLLHREQQAREAADEANAAKTRFLGMVSHELRTPLTSIKGFASTLLAEDVEWDADSQHDFIVTIAQESDKLHELVEQLLDASRLQSGRLQITRTPLTMRDILHVADAQLETLAAAHEIRYDLPPDLPALHADDQRIAQVLANLVSNAVKHSPAGSEIIIRAREAAGTVQIDVCDQGDGIPAEAQEYVFEAFRQVRDQPHAEGAGLGLAICKGLVEAHGGAIWISETSSDGTTMSFTVPMVESGAAGEDAPGNGEGSAHN